MLQQFYCNRFKVVCMHTILKKTEGIIIYGFTKLQLLYRNTVLLVSMISAVHTITVTLINTGFTLSKNNKLPHSNLLLESDKMLLLNHEN